MHIIVKRSLAVGVGLVLGVAAASACSSTTTSSTSGTTAAPGTTSTPGTTGAGGTATTGRSTGTTEARGTATTGTAVKAGPVVVTTKNNATLGEIVADGTGRTLYAFADDTATTSACTGACANAWPPLTGDKVEPAGGLTAADFTSLTRPDGTVQVVFKGHPLYTFAADTDPEDAYGQGSSDKWYVLGPDGAVITKSI